MDQDNVQLVLLVTVNFVADEEHCMQKVKLATMDHEVPDYLQSLPTMPTIVLLCSVNLVNIALQVAD